RAAHGPDRGGHRRARRRRAGGASPLRRHVDDRVAAAKAALEAHPAVTSVELVGSRATGRTHRLSDWELSVQADDFALISADLPGLVAPLRPLHHFWDPCGRHWAYMVILPGPTKLDLSLFDEPHEYAPPSRAS